MNGEYNRHDTPMMPGSFWPDGTPVSNWSQAIARLKHGSRPLQSPGAGQWNGQPHDRSAVLQAGWLTD